MRQYTPIMLAVQVTLVGQILIAGFERTVQPASVIARASSGAALLSSELLWLNPAATADTLPLNASVFYAPSRFGLTELASFGVLTGMQWQGWNVAGGIQSFGFSLYRETSVSAAAATMLRPGVAAGIAVHWHHVSVSRYGNGNTFSIDVGSSLALSEMFRFGAAIQNITGAGFGVDDDIPRSMTAGFAIPLERFGTFTIDAVKQEQGAAAYRTGVQLKVHGSVTVSAGTQSDTGILFGGCSFIVLSFRLDYAVSLHPVLGMSQTIGIIIE